MKILKYNTGPIYVNTYLVYDETGNGFIVDPGGYNRSLVEEIKKNKLVVEHIILTHGHGDHIGGIKRFRKEFPGIKLVANINEKELLETPDLNLSPVINGKLISESADIYVSDADTMRIGDMELAFIATPGHTPGGQSILLEDVCFCGDTLFRASIGRTDFKGGDMDTLVNSVKTRLMTLPDETRMLPGHMEETTVRYEKEHNPFVR